MGWIILIVAGFIGFAVLNAFLNEKKRGTMDKDGNMHCKRCGCTTFTYDKGKYGESITKCVNCGQSWKTM